MLEELNGLETAMWQSATRLDLDWMAAHMAEDFLEYGKSGRTYTRADILEQTMEPFQAVLPLANLELRELAPGIAIVNYQSELRGERANRCSIWRQTETTWQMVFHQGTPIPN